MKLILDRKSYFVDTVIKIAKTFAEMNFQVSSAGVRLCAPNMNNTIMVEGLLQSPQDSDYTFNIQMSDLADIFTSFDKGDIELTCDGVTLKAVQGKKVITQRLNDCQEMPSIPPVPLPNSFIARGEDLFDFIKLFKGFETIGFDVAPDSLSCLAEVKAKTVQNALDINLSGDSCHSNYKVAQLMGVLEVFKGQVQVSIADKYPLLIELQGSETMDLKVLVAPSGEE